MVNSDDDIEAIEIEEATTDFDAPEEIVDASAAAIEMPPKNVIRKSSAALAILRVNWFFIILFLLDMPLCLRGQEIIIFILNLF